VSRGRRARGAPQVYWRSRGQGEATLLLVNGYSASSLAWPREWVAGLAESFRVIMPDNRGSGFSRQVETPFSIADMAADLVDVLDDAEVDRAVVMGHSMGGMIAQQLALDAPRRVAGLALVGTRPPVPRFTPPSPRVLTALMRPVLPGESLRAYLRRLWALAAAPGFAAAEPEAIEELVDQTAERPTPRAMLTAQLRAMSGWGHAERLARLGLPTAIVHGSVDRFVPPANGHALAELIAGSRLVEIEGIGHLVPQEAPELLAAELRGLAAEADGRVAVGATGNSSVHKEER